MLSRLHLFSLCLSTANILIIDEILAPPNGIRYSHAVTSGVGKISQLAK